MPALHRTVVGCVAEDITIAASLVAQLIGGIIVEVVQNAASDTVADTRRRVVLRQIGNWERSIGHHLIKEGKFRGIVTRLIP